MQTFSIPSKFKPNLVGEWLESWNRVRDSDILSLDLDPEAFLSPAAIALLAAGIADRKERGLETQLRIKDLNSDAIRYLQRIDFFHELGVELPESFARHPEEHFVPLKRIESPSLARTLANQISAVLETELSEASISVLRSLRFVLEEQGVNIVQHSQRPATGFGLAQAYLNRNRIQFAFADAGIGFKASLQRNPELRGRVEDDGVALQLAFEQGLSGIGGRTNMGFGLHMLGKIADSLGADLWLLSGTACLHRSSIAGRRVAAIRAVPEWQGAWICLDTGLIPQHYGVS